MKLNRLQIPVRSHDWWIKNIRCELVVLRYGMVIVMSKLPVCCFGLPLTCIFSLAVLLMKQNRLLEVY
jgi:hypothetical protein